MFKRIVPPRNQPGRHPTECVTLSKNSVRLSPKIVKELELKQYPFISFAYDQGLNKLAILRHQSKRVDTFKINPLNGSIVSKNLLRELNGLVSLDDTRRYNPIRQRVMDVEAIVVDLNLPI